MTLVKLLSTFSTPGVRSKRYTGNEKPNNNKQTNKKPRRQKQAGAMNYVTCSENACIIEVPISIQPILSGYLTTRLTDSLLLNRQTLKIIDPRSEKGQSEATSLAVL